MKKLKDVFDVLLCILVSFTCIYLLVFFGGWKLLESGNIIGIEIAVSVLVGLIFFVLFKVLRAVESDIKNLQNQIDQLQKQIEDFKKSK